MLSNINGEERLPETGGGLSAVPFSREAILKELDRLSRGALMKKKALQKMLRFVVEATLDDQAASLKEYTIATLVFGKGDDFDPRMTTLVRTQAHKLREVLQAHYAGDSNHTGPWLWIPPGSYRAVFDCNPAHNRLGKIAEATSGGLRLTIPRCHVAHPTVLARGSDLSSVASAVHRLQSEHAGWARRVTPPSEPTRRLRDGMNDGAGMPCDFEVKHTIVELDDSLLLTAYLLAGEEKSVLFGRSFSVSWAGNPVASISQIAPELSAFVCAVERIIETLDRSGR